MVVYVINHAALHYVLLCLLYLEFDRPDCPSVFLVFPGPRETKVRSGFPVMQSDLRRTKNLNGNDISFDEDPEAYEAQPVEKDAREFANRIKEEVNGRQ